MSAKLIQGNITDATEGTEELAHLEMISAILYQLTSNLSEDVIEKSPFSKYFVDHTTGIYPVAASGTPFDMKYVGVKGDTIADLNEDLAADGATIQEQLFYRKSEIPMNFNRNILRSRNSFINSYVIN